MSFPSPIGGRFIPSLILFAICLTACGQSPGGASERLTVYAAASLTDVFGDIGAAYEAAHPGVAISLNLAGSQQLAQQLAQGAPADVFASAGEAAMATAVADGRVDGSAARPFAGNRLVVIVPSANEAGLKSADDLARPGIRLVIADGTVPAGQYARVFLAAASTPDGFGDDYEKNVLGNVVSYEQNVRAVLAKVTLGEADAGIVYDSDVAGGEVARIPIPDRLNVMAAYVIAPTRDSAAPELAAGFIRFVLSQDGQAILERHGFLPAHSAAP